MDDSTELEDPNEDPLPAREHAGGRENLRDESVRPLASGTRRPEVESEIKRWVGLNDTDRANTLRSVIEGSHLASLEALVYLCRRAHEVGDRRMLNLAFEALSKQATPLLLSRTWGVPRESRVDQVQEILIATFKSIQTDKADFLEINFAAFAKRKAVSLYRTHRARFEGANERIEPTEEFDPIDHQPARIASPEAQALLARSLDKLSPKHRTAFIQYHCFQRTQEEIAEHCGVTVRTVYSWLKTAEATVGLSGDDNDR